MAAPLIVDLPHRLGAEEAKRRIARGMERLSGQVPGGARVESGWTGNRLDLDVTAMAQRVSASIEVNEADVRIELAMPAALRFLTPAIEAAIRRKGAAMLEDRSSR
jgi:hypothetical protein